MSRSSRRGRTWRSGADETTTHPAWRGIRRSPRRWAARSCRIARGPSRPLRSVYEHAPCANTRFDFQPTILEREEREVQAVRVSGGDLVAQPLEHDTVGVMG